MTNFRYLNVNPDKSIEQDCVIRAIKRASGIPYNAVSKLLKATAQEHGCDELCVCCYHHLLEDTLEYRLGTKKEGPQNDEAIDESKLIKLK